MKSWICDSCGYLNQRNRPGNCAQRSGHAAVARKKLRQARRAQLRQAGYGLIG